MHVSKILAISALGASGVLAQDAPSTSATEVTGNPADKAFVANLPEQPFWTTGTLDGNVKGSVSAKAGPDGVGVTFDVKFSNLPKEGGPFSKYCARCYDGQPIATMFVKRDVSNLSV